MNIISMNHISKHRPTITTKEDSKYCTATAIRSGKMDHLQKSHNLLHTQVERKTCPGKQQKKHNLDTIIDTSTKTTSNDAFLLGCALGHPHTQWRLSMRPKTFGSIGGCKERRGDAKSGASKVGTSKVN